jgi:hypothetical protein
MWPAARRDGDGLRAVQRSVEWTHHTQRTLSQNVGVDHGGADVRMPEQFLHRADVASRLKQVRSEAVAERVAGSRLRNARLSDRRPHCPLYDTLVHMMTNDATRRTSR